MQAYSAMSPNGEPAAPILGSAVTSAASLPPMSTFRGSGAVGANTGTGAPSPASLQYSHSPGAPTNAPSAPNPAPTTNQPPATGDNLGKTLASVVSTRVSTRPSQVVDPMRIGLFLRIYICMRENAFLFSFFFFFSIIPARFQPDLPHGPISIEL